MLAGPLGAGTSNKWGFTYVVRLQLHSVAEDKRVEVGLLEDLVEGGFVLEKQKHTASQSTVEARSG